MTPFRRRVPASSTPHRAPSYLRPLRDQLDGTAYPGNSGSRFHRHPATGIISSVLVKESALKTPSGITYAIPVQKLKALLEGS
jgi:hypothetical protein